MIDVMQLAGAGGGGIPTVLPAPAELFWGAVAFGIFYWVMQKIAFPRINQVLEERAASIQGRQEQAQETLNEAQRIRDEYQEQLSDARGEANRIIEEARETAEALRRDIVAKADSEAESIVERAQAEVRAERERAVQQLRSEVGRLSIQLAEKIVHKELDQQAHQGLVDRYIEQLAGSGNGEVGTAPAGTSAGEGE
ncbi:MAG: F0F1 ATP synthase subunit B [Actinomycetota bacterium]|nr:F0F1 ATP synthase subunit B [Actinomycetota bacterium]